MLRPKDIILLTVLLLSMSAGAAFPDWGRGFQPYLVYFMMILLFLSFLSIEMTDIKGVLVDSWSRVVLLTLLKIVVLPVSVFWLFQAVYPDFAVAALLLAGISTGVVAPFISGFVGGNGALVLALVVVTSLLTPFTLPALVEFLVGRTIEIPAAGMIRMLAQVIFIPMALGAVLRRARPRWAAGLVQSGFPVSLICFALINLGVFSRYAMFFKQKPSIVLTAAAVAVVLGAIHTAAGLVAAWSWPVADRIAAAVSMNNVNNVLVIVFASQFFGAVEPTLAAMYMFPFFGVIVPLRIYQRRHEARGNRMEREAA